MGYTGDSGPGLVTVDLLPITYSFEMIYDGLSDRQDGVDVNTDPLITFYTDDLKSGGVNVSSGIEMAVFPNPFNGNTTIAFSTEESTDVNISVYDQTGRLIEVLQEGKLIEGNHKIIWDASGVNKGLYILRLNSDDKVVHQNIVKM